MDAARNCQQASSDAQDGGSWKSSEDGTHCEYNCAGAPFLTLVVEHHTASPSHTPKELIEALQASQGIYDYHLAYGLQWSQLSYDVTFMFKEPASQTEGITVTIELDSTVSWPCKEGDTYCKPKEEDMIKIKCCVSKRVHDFFKRNVTPVIKPEKTQHQRTCH